MLNSYRNNERKAVKSKLCLLQMQWSQKTLRSKQHTDRCQPQSFI